MRRLLIFGVCFALALQGAAQASVVEKPCPMQKAGNAHAAQVAKTSHGWCNDADTITKTGKTCKTCNACAAAGAWLMSTQDFCSFPPATVSLVSSPEPFAFCIGSRGHWRPPALS
jgi:hypothetical protein